MQGTAQGRQSKCDGIHVCVRRKWTWLSGCSKEGRPQLPPDLVGETYTWWNPAQPTEDWLEKVTSRLAPQAHEASAYGRASLAFLSETKSRKQEKSRSPKSVCGLIHLRIYMPRQHSIYFNIIFSGHMPQHSAIDDAIYTTVWSLDFQHSLPTPKPVTQPGFWISVEGTTIRLQHTCRWPPWLFPSQLIHWQVHWCRYPLCCGPSPSSHHVPLEWRELQPLSMFSPLVFLLPYNSVATEQPQEALKVEVRIDHSGLRSFSGFSQC